MLNSACPAIPARIKLSYPIRISVIRRTPAAAQAARSLGDIDLDAVVISGDSAPLPQNSWNPSLVLLARTAGVLNGPDLAKWSATSVLKG